MPNNLNIAEFLLADLANSLAEPNLLGEPNARKQWDQPRVVRVTDHMDDYEVDPTGVFDPDDPYTMALFKSEAHGKPWKKEVNCQEHLIHAPDDGLAPTPDMNIIFPDFDYTTFE